MKSAEESMHILAAYDLTGSYRAAAKLAGCSHHTVARVVAERDAGGACPRERRPRTIDEFLPKIEEWVYDSENTIRADKAHEKLVAMGFTGSLRSSRRAAGPWSGSPAVGDRAGVVVAV